jgi:hypothetical protein
MRPLLVHPRALAELVPSGPGVPLHLLDHLRSLKKFLSLVDIVYRRAFVRYDIHLLCKALAYVDVPGSHER